MKTLSNSIILSIGILLGGCAIAIGLANVKSNTRTVYVKGLCEIQKPADHVIWPIKYTETGNDLILIYNQLESKNKIVSNFLQENGIDPKDISMSAPNVVDKQADQYNNNTGGARYIATQIITVSSKQVDKVRQLMIKQAELLKSGIAVSTSWDSQPQFLFTDLESVKPQMIEQATKNARVTGEKFAQDSQSKLGKIVTASQGQLSIEDRDANTPYIKTLRVVTSIEYSLED